MCAEKGDAGARAWRADLKQIGNTDRLVKSDVQRGSVSVLSVAVARRDGDKHELGKDRFQVTAIGGMASEFVKVSLMKLQQGERGLGQEQISGTPYFSDDLRRLVDARTWCI